MNSNRWELIQTLFEASLELEPEKRHDFLLRETKGDLSLLEEIEALIRADTGDEDTMLATSALGYLNEAVEQENSVIGSYRILRILGKGGMGIVYLAERVDGQFEQKVALKVIKKGLDSESVIKRFNQERQILARLNHPNIAKLLDGGVSPDGRPFFALEYIEGRPIVKFADEQRLSITERLNLFRSVCQAVHYAHQNLVVHRDLKPSNILVTEDGVVKLLDFGISKILNDDSEDALITKTGQMLLTPSYASPEQIMEKPVTTTTDVYSLGIILYELLAGKRPFSKSRSVAEVKDLVLKKDPTRPSDAFSEIVLVDEDKRDTSSPSTISEFRSTTENGLRKMLLGDLDNIVLMALRKDPDRRYQSAEIFERDIERHLQGRTVSARKETTSYRLQKFVRRHRIGVAASFLATLAFASTSYFYVTRLAEERDKAIVEKEKTEQVVEFVSDLFYTSDPNESQGKDVTARDMLRIGIEKIDEDLEDQEEIQSQLRQVIGGILLSLGDNSEAKVVLEKSLAQERILSDGIPTPGLANALNLMGIVEGEIGDFAVSGALFKESHDMNESLFGPFHPRVATGLENIAQWEVDAGNFVRADSLYRRLIEVNKTIHPEGHENLVDAMTDLGGMLRLNDQLEEAETLLRDALEIQQEIHKGRRHLDVSSTQRRLASLLRTNEEYEEAESLYLDALATRRQLLGNDNINVANLLDSYAKLKLKLGQVDSAYALQKESVEIAEKVYGGQPRANLAIAYSNLGIVAGNAGNVEDAIEAFKKSILINEASRETDDIQIAFPLNELGYAYRKTGRYLESIEHIRRALKIRSESLHPEHRHLMDSKVNLASSLIEVGDLGEAETLLLEAYKILNRVRGPDSGRTRGAAKTLGKLYELQGNLEASTRYKTLGE